MFTKVRHNFLMVFHMLLEQSHKREKEPILKAARRSNVGDTTFDAED